MYNFFRYLFLEEYIFYSQEVLLDSCRVSLVETNFPYTKHKNRNEFLYSQSHHSFTEK